jgi:regulatory protein
LIKLELKQKGISQEIIESRIKNQELGSDSDLEQAKKLVEKKMGRFRNKFGMTRNEVYQKLGRFLASKGFNWDIIKKAIDEVLGKGV